VRKFQNKKNEPNFRNHEIEKNYKNEKKRTLIPINLGTTSPNTKKFLVFAKVVTNFTCLLEAQYHSITSVV
jgi:hypothetical protein